jgi:hypothetical protein
VFFNAGDVGSQGILSLSTPPYDEGAKLGRRTRPCYKLISSNLRIILTAALLLIKVLGLLLSIGPRPLYYLGRVLSIGMRIQAKHLLGLLGGVSVSAFTSSNNAIDRLTTDADVITFWDKALHLTPALRFEHYNPKYPPHIAFIADSLGTRDWWKTDLDHNSETDLLIFRRQGATELTFALASQGTYRVVSPTYASEIGLIYPVVKRLHDRNAIFLYHQIQLGYDDEAKRFLYSPLLCDTLVYAQGHVLNYVAQPRRHRLEQVIVENDGRCEGDCPTMRVVIDAQHLVATAEREDKEQGKRKHYRGTLPATRIKEVLGILNYANFPALDSTYQARMYDLTTTKLTVVYDGGKRKVVRDYGSSGTCTLAVLYGLATDLKWELKR